MQGPGKTREEMVREARGAYRRRDAEIAQRRNQVDGSVGNQRRAEWWEAVGLDGAISPVTEEVSNPMEEVIVFNERGFADGERNHEEANTKSSKDDNDEKGPEENRPGT